MSKAAKDWSDVYFLPNACLQVEQGTSEIEGTTSFFRRYEGFQRLIKHLKNSTLHSEPEILVTPCSIGCEAYTLAIMADHMGLYEQYPNLRIYGLDIDAGRIDWAQRGLFGVQFMTTIPPEYRHYFARHDYPSKAKLPINDYWHKRMVSAGALPNAVIEVPGFIRDRVTFLPAQDVFEHWPKNGRYDAVTCFSLLEHIPDEATRLYTHLLNIADRVCHDSTRFMHALHLSEAFRGVAKDARFFAVTESLEKIGPVTWDSPGETLRRISSSGGRQDIGIVCRL